MEVKPIAAAEAKEFIRLHHYSRSAQAGVLRYGWYDGEELLGVSIYNTGFRDMQNGVFGPEPAEHVLHHHRLAITDAARQRDLQVSAFIAECNRILGEMGYWALVTYADQDFGNVGTIYQATNALFTGIRAKGNIYFKTPDGEVMSVSSHLGKTWSERRAEAKRRGWTEHRSKGRLRYVYMLGTKSERRKRRKMLRWEVLPYPELDF